MTADGRDVEAWELAITMLRESGEAVWLNNVDRMLEERGLEETGKWAAHQCNSFRYSRGRG